MLFRTVRSESAEDLRKRTLPYATDLRTYYNTSALLRYTYWEVLCPNIHNVLNVKLPHLDDFSTYEYTSAAHIGEGKSSDPVFSDSAKVPTE